MDHLKEIRKKMKRDRLDVWIVRSVDAHGSEYLCGHDNVLRWASGFTGENAEFIITLSEAKLWIDGRFFISAEKEIKNREITLMKQGLPGVLSAKEWLDEYLKENAGKELNISYDPEFADEIWEDRPPRPSNPIYVHAGLKGVESDGTSEYEDRSSAEKISIIRKWLSAHDKHSVSVKSLDNINWITNLRGSDIEYNTVFFSYMYISADNAIIFLQRSALTEETEEYLAESGIAVSDYEKFDEFVNEVSGEKTADEAFIGKIKSIKTENETKRMCECNLRDATAVTKFIFRLKTEQLPEDELQAASILEELRSRDDRFVSLSFPTISAYGENAAIVHYATGGENNAKLEPQGLYLVDSGAQYLDGTTDITRTISLGKLSDAERKHYTLVMCAMLRLMNAKFSRGTSGRELDRICREPLEKYGLDFRHGTGHGIGYFNCVHEAPVRISNSQSCGDMIFEPGMITSDEPGVYIEGSHGVRIENMLVCIKDADGLAFSNMTWAPLDRAAVDVKYMTEEDIENYNLYQAGVREKLVSYLSKEENEWLAEETAPIGQDK